MAAGPVISRQKILAASQGDSSALREVLEVMTQVSAQQQAVSGTTPVSGATPGIPNPAAPVPPQATGLVSILNGSYIVQITNPGAKSPISQIQAAQAAGSANPQTPLQPVVAIFHQIRASTSPAFNINSNTQIFGGNTGAIQNYWTLTGLGTGTWFIQFRSSYDGVNFNQWKNANGGSALGGLINQVTEETVGDANWALFTLPGSLITGIGSAQLFDGEIFDLAQQVYSSGMVAIAGPNGFYPQVNGLYGPAKCDVALQTPSGVVAGIPDFPVEVLMKNAVFGGTNTTSGYANLFAIAFDPTNPNVSIVPDPAGTATWAILRLPGGARIALGQGQNTHGDTIFTPGVPWFSLARMISIVSLTDVTPSGNDIEGYGSAVITAGVLSAQTQDDTGTLIACKGNWMAIAWETGAPVQTVGGFPFLEINLQGGHAVVIGAGVVASGTPVALPAGYVADSMLSVCTPASTTHTGDNLRGVQLCDMIGLVPVLQYTDNVHMWAGDVNWMLAAWK